MSFTSSYEWSYEWSYEFLAHKETERRITAKGSLQLK